MKNMFIRSLVMIVVFTAGAGLLATGLQPILDSVIPSAEAACPNGIATAGCFQAPGSLPPGPG